MAEASERAVVALLCEKCQAFTSSSAGLQPDDFQNDSLRHIYHLLLEFHRNGLEWSWASVIDALQQTVARPNDLDFPQSYCAELMVHACTEADLPQHVKEITQLRVRRRLIETLPLLAQDIKNPTLPLPNLLTSIKRLEQVMSESGVSSPILELGPSNFSDNFWAEIHKMRNTAYVGSGFSTLDSHLDWGLAPGHISIICGRPSMGKSTLRSNITVNLAKAGISSLTVIRESTILSEGLRLISICDRIPLKRMTKNIRVWEQVGMEQWMKARIASIQSEWPIVLIEPTTQYFLTDIRHTLRQKHAQGFFPKVIFIDLFAQLDDVGVADNQAAVMQEKINQAANMAKEFQVHFCLIVQLKRNNNQKGHKREDLDMREQLKGTGGYEERGDLILMVERPSYYDKELDDTIMNVTILKQRDGATPKIQMSFDKHSLQITDDLEGSAWTPIAEDGEQFPNFLSKDEKEVKHDSTSHPTH